MDTIRYAWRTLVKMPVVSGVIVVSLAIGIGVNTAVFSWIEAVILRPLPGVPSPGDFHSIEVRAETGSYAGVSWLEYRDLQNRLRAFPDLLAFRPVPFNVGDTGRSRRTYGLLVSGNYFSSLGLRPAMGRYPTPDEAKSPGREPVVVVSHDFWRTQLAASPDAMGRTIRVNDRQLTVIGVTPERFQGTVISLTFDLYVPATMAPALVAGSTELENRSLRGYAAMGRLRPGTSPAVAEAEVAQAMRELARSYPESNATLTGEVVPFWKATRGPQRMLSSALVVLQSILILLLLAVCGNTTNLMLARASARYREMGVRLALGSGRWRVMSLVMTEHVLLALGGAALGALIAAWASEALRNVPVIGAFPIKLQTSLDAGALAFAMLLGVACGVLCGLAPALQLAAVDAQAALHAGSRTAGRSGIRSALMGIEVGLALVVLMAAALFLRSFTETRDADPGFTREGVLLAAYDFSGRQVDNAFARTFARQLLDGIRALPDVQAASIASSVPLDIHGLPLRSFALEGRVRPDARDTALTNTVTPGYFATMAIPFTAGTDFTSLDDENTPPQAIVNDAFVRRFLADAEPLGRRLETRGTQYAITGVVRTSISDAFGEPPTPVIYLSYRDRPSARGEIHIRTRAGAESLIAPQLERITRGLDAELPLYDIRTLTDHVEKNLFFRRIPARMFLVLGPLLLILAAIGIYAVVAYSVSRRTVEIGVRLALGATPNGLVARVLAETLRVVVAGALVGWSIALVVNLHLVRGPLYLSVFGGVPFLLLLVAGVACWVPARRAAGVDPMIALRHE